MTTSHTETPAAAVRDSSLPAVRRRRRRRDWGRQVARALCVLLALLGVLPCAATVAVRSAWARGWAARETERLLHEQGIEARYGMALKVWPLAVELTDVRIESSDQGVPLLECPRARARPKLFALLAGKLAIDQIEIDQPRIRVVVRDGQLVNLALPPAKKDQPKTVLHAPFNTFALTDAAVDLTVDEHARVGACSLDLDVTAEDDRTLGSSFELSVRAGLAKVQRPRTGADGKLVVDDDALCAVEGRARIEPGSVLVRRFEGAGSADLDAAPGTTPACDLPMDDKRRVELSIGHLRVMLPTDAGRLPALDGHVRVRAPLALGERLASLPETDGWIAVDTDVRYADDTVLPELSGTLEAHDVRLLQYSFAQELHSQFFVRRNVVTSPVTTLGLGGGLVTLTDTVVDPLAKGARLEKTKLDVANVDFTTLLRNLGVHKSSWVGWDIREVHVPVVSGTLVPLKLDGELTARTSNFGVYDRPAEEKARERIFGVTDAQIASHLAIRPDALKFVDTRVTLPRSQIEGALVSIGFHNELRVDAPKVTADLEDVSPIGPVALHGKAQVSGLVTGTFNTPAPVGDIQAIPGFAVADMQFGDISAGHVKVDVHAPTVEITGVRAKRRESPYEVPTATLKIGGSKGFLVDAVGTSPGFGLRDLLSMFALDEDPRYDGLEAKIATRAEVHVALGGPEDTCGSGFIAIDAKGHLTDVGLFGERFAQGDADVSLHWYDRQAGIAGADIDVRSFVLSKVQPPSGTRAGVTGTVLGSASIQRGGAVSGNVMVEGVPLGRFDTLGAYASEVEGSISGMAHVSGDLDDFHAGAGLVTRAELDASATRFRGVAFPSSHLEVDMTQRFPEEKRMAGRTRCGAPVPPPFDKAAYLGDTTSHGEWRVNGELFGGTVRLTDVVATRAKAPHLSGRIALRGVDLGSFARVYANRKPEAEEDEAPASSALGGQLWGELIADDVPLDDPAHARVSFSPRAHRRLARGQVKLTLRPPKQPLVIAGDALTMPPLEVALDASGGFTGGFTLSGSASGLTRDPALALEAQLRPIDVAVVQRLVPRVDRARGKIEGG